MVQLPHPWHVYLLYHDPDLLALERGQYGVFRSNRRRRHSQWSLLCTSEHNAYLSHHPSFLRAAVALTRGLHGALPWGQDAQFDLRRIHFLLPIKDSI